MPRSTSTFSLLVLLTVPLCGAATAQQAPPAPPVATTSPAPLGLAETLRLLPGAPGWRAADLALESARRAADAARARAGLSASASTDYTALRTPLEGEWRGGGTATVTASGTLLPWSPAFEEVRAAERAADRALLERRADRSDLVLDVTQQYRAARLAQADADLAGAQATLARRQFEITRRQREEGVATNEGLLDRQAALEDAEARLAGARTNAALSVQSLFSTLGLTARTVTLTDAPAEPAEPAPVEEAVARALTNRAEIRGAEGRVTDAEIALEAARRDRAVPDLNVGARYGQLGQGPQASGTVLSGNLNLKSGVGLLGLSAPFSGAAGDAGLSVTLSGRFDLLSPAGDAAIRSSDTALASARLSLDSARASVELDVRQKHAALVNARAALNAARTSVIRADTALATARARQAAGLGTELDVAGADLAALQARRALEGAVSNASLASLALARATGDLDPALIVTPTGGPQ